MAGMELNFGSESEDLHDEDLPEPPAKATPVQVKTEVVDEDADGPIAAAAEPWVWKAMKVCPPVDPNPKVRAADRQRAMMVIEDKPVKFCAKLTCMIVKSGKQPWCGAHRKTADNSKSDAVRQSQTEAYEKTMNDKTSPEADELLDMYLLEVGLPGQRLGMKAGDFDWHCCLFCKGCF